MSSRVRRRFEFTSEAIQGQIIADNVLEGVNSKVEHPICTLQASGEGVVVVNYSSGLDANAICRSERKRGIHVQFC